MMNKSMKLDISKIEFEEAYDNTPFQEYTLYFIAPRDLVKDKYPEAEHSTISLELTTRTTMISPTKDGVDYDWYDIELDNDTIDRLIALYILYKKPKERTKTMTNTFIICNSEDEIKSNMSCWGNDTFELSTEDIMALLKGKTLATDNGEYGIFIKLEDENAKN